MDFAAMGWRDGNLYMHVFKMLLIISHQEYTLQQKHLFPKVAASTVNLLYHGGLTNANKLPE